VLLAGPAESPPVQATLEAIGWSVDRMAPPIIDRPLDDAARAPAARSRAVAEILREHPADLIAAVGPPWWLGIAAQARAAALEDQPARWLLWPSPAHGLNPAAPPTWGHEAAFLDRLARDSASWIAPPGPATEAALPNHTSFDRWLAALPHPAENRRIMAEQAAGRISLGVVLVHRDRPGLAAAALESLAAQTHRPDAVAVVDAASTDRTAVTALKRTTRAFRAAPARLIEAPTASLGAARTLGAMALGTDWLLFLDDDNRLAPDALAAFARAAATGTADIWTCWAALFHGTAPPADADNGPVYRPLGPVPGLAGAANVLGDANLLIRRTALDRLGGFDPDPGTGAEDWDLLVRALLAGIPQAVVPHVLLWKRHSPTGMAATMDHDRARARVQSRLRAARIPV